MKVAIVFSKDTVSQHFGHSEGFKIYDLDDKKNIVGEETIMNTGIKGCEMANLFASYDVNTVIVGGIGEHAVRNLEEQDISVILGAEGPVTDVIFDFCHDSLKLNDIKPHASHHHHGANDHHCC